MASPHAEGVVCALGVQGRGIKTGRGFSGVVNLEQAHKVVFAEVSKSDTSAAIRTLFRCPFTSNRNAGWGGCGAGTTDTSKACPAWAAHTPRRRSRQPVGRWSDSGCSGFLRPESQLDIAPAGRLTVDRDRTRKPTQAAVPAPGGTRRVSYGASGRVNSACMRESTPAPPISSRSRWQLRACSSCVLHEVKEICRRTRGTAPVNGCMSVRNPCQK